MYEVTMPKLSDSMETGQILEWKVREGDQVREGDVLADIESDKATLELECFRAGTMARILHGDGAEVPVGQTIALIAEEGETIQPPEQPRPARPEPQPQPSTPPPPQAPAEKPKPPPQPGQRLRISPHARKLAEQHGVDPTKLPGSGPGGRIIARDVEAAAAQPPQSASPRRELRKEKDIDPMALALATRRGIDPTAIAGTGTGGRITVDDVLAAAPRPSPVSPADQELPPLEVAPDEADLEEAPFRLKTQAMRVTASKHLIPHFYLTRGADVTRLLELKDKLKAEFGATVTHFVLKACLEAVKRHPEVNRSYDRGRIINWKGIHLGLAVETERGLTVAVLRDAQDLSLAEVAERTRGLVEKARAGKLSAAERRHPSLTVTNLGMLDVEHFAPIINPPSSITIGVASALPAPVVRGDAVCIRTLMRLTLSCDHRIVDGVTAARFLGTLKGLLEDPDALL